MASSEENNIQNDGFETWESTKKKTSKLGSRQQIVAEDRASKRDEGMKKIAMTDTGAETGTQKMKRTSTKGAKAKRGNGRRRKAVGEETVVITEKEYRQLLSIKNPKASASLHVDSDILEVGMTIHGKNVCIT